MSIPVTNHQKRPFINEYQDPVAFLKDWVAFLKTTSSRFSLRQLAQKSDVSVSYLTMILKKERPLTNKFFNKIAPNLSLTQLELKTLERLLGVIRSKSAEEKSKALRHLQNLRSYRQSNPAEWEVHKYLSNWFHLAIREMVQLEDFKNDLSWIQERLIEKLPQNEISRAIELLLELHLLDNDDGKLSISKRTLQCHDDVFRISLGNFHAEMLKLAAKSISKTSREKRLILGSTIGLPKEKIPELFSMIQEFQRKMEKWSEPFQNIDEIYHIEMATFPLTKKKGDPL